MSNTLLQTSHGCSTGLRAGNWDGPSISFTSSMFPLIPVVWLGLQKITLLTSVIPDQSTLLGMTAKIFHYKNVFVNEWFHTLHSLHIDSKSECAKPFWVEVHWSECSVKPIRGLEFTDMHLLTVQSAQKRFFHSLFRARYAPFGIKSEE